MIFKSAFFQVKQIHQGCLSSAKLGVAFSQPCCTDQTLLLLTIFLLPDLHTSLDNHSKLCSKPNNKPKIVFLLENTLMGLWQKLLEFSCVYKPQYQSNYISSKLLSVKPLHLVTFLESKICNSLTIYLFKFSM